MHLSLKYLISVNAAGKQFYLAPQNNNNNNNNNNSNNNKTEKKKRKNVSGD